MFYKYESTRSPWKKTVGYTTLSVIYFSSFLSSGMHLVPSFITKSSRLIWAGTMSQVLVRYNQQLNEDLMRTL